MQTPIQRRKKNLPVQFGQVIRFYRQPISRLVKTPTDLTTSAVEHYYPAHLVHWTDSEKKKKNEETKTNDLSSSRLTSPSLALLRQLSEGFQRADAGWLEARRPPRLVEGAPRGDGVAGREAGRLRTVRPDLWGELALALELEPRLAGRALRQRHLRASDCRLLALGKLRCAVCLG